VKTCSPAWRVIHRRYGLSHRRRRSCGQGVPVLHPGPVNRWGEMSGVCSMTQAFLWWTSRYATHSDPHALLYLDGSSGKSPSPVALLAGSEQV